MSTPSPLLNTGTSAADLAATYTGISLKTEEGAAAEPKSVIGLQAKPLPMNELQPADNKTQLLYHEVQEQNQVMEALAERLLNPDRITKLKDPKLETRVTELFTAVTGSSKNPDEIKQLAGELQQLAAQNETKLKKDPALRQYLPKSLPDGRGAQKISKNTTSQASSVNLRKDVPAAASPNLSESRKPGISSSPSKPATLEPLGAKSDRMLVLNKKLSDLTNKFADNLQKMAPLQNEKLQLESDISKLEESLKKEKGKLISSGKTIKAMEAELETKRENLKGVVRELGGVEGTKKAISEEQAKLTKELGAIKADLKNASTDLAKARQENPSTFHRSQGYAKGGLSSDEAQKLDLHIGSNMKAWEDELASSPPGKHKHIPHDLFLPNGEPNAKSRIPRSIDVFMENGEMKVMVLCKTKVQGKEGVEKDPKQLVGKGVAKSVKRAVEWQSGQVYAEAVMKSEDGYVLKPADKLAIKKELESHNKVAGQPGISEPSIGYTDYTSKDVDMAGNPLQKTRFYQPLYENETLQNYVIKQQAGGTLTTEMEAKLIDTLLDGAITLKNNNMLHQDLKEDNQFVDAQGGVRLGDFGTAASMPTPESGKNISSHELDQGNKDFRAPERQLLTWLGEKMKDEFLSSHPEIKELMEQKTKAVDNRNKATTEIEVKKYAKEYDDITVKLTKTKDKLRPAANNYVEEKLTPLYGKYASGFETYATGLEILGIVTKQNIKQPTGEKSNMLALQTGREMNSVLLEASSSLTPEILENRAPIEITPGINRVLKKIGLEGDFPVGNKVMISDILDKIISKHIDGIPGSDKFKGIDQSKMSAFEQKVLTDMRRMVSTDPEKRMSLDEAKTILANLPRESAAPLTPPSTPPVS